MVLTLFEQAVPMTNVAYYKADTDQALHDINEVISVPSTNGKNRLNDKYDATNIYEVKDASFKYWNQQTYVLSDINFNVNQAKDCDCGSFWFRKKYITTNYGWVISIR